MQRKFLPEAERFTKRNSRRRIWHKIVGTLGCLVVFCTTYALILPAITMEMSCALEEHTHDASCYAQVATGQAGQLACTSEALGLHVHAAGCYDSEGNNQCGYADFVLHTHDDSCKDASGNVVCQLPQIVEHTHTDACYSVQPAVEGHTHEDACYTQQDALTCALAEGEGHTHSDSCYTLGETPICQTAEGEAHTHSDSCFEKTLTCTTAEADAHLHDAACYTSEKVLTCTVEETAAVAEQRVLLCGAREASFHVHDGCAGTCGKLETLSHVHGAGCVKGETEQTLTCSLTEHTHQLACYSNPSKDVESVSDWEKGLPELTGIAADDVLAIAESQLGYKESTKNYVVLEDGETMKGITRYGQWYGVPYGDWCAMFASFCVRYAYVEDIPVHSVVNTWIELLEEEDMYRLPDQYAAEPGDLVFFNNNENPDPDHVGIVKEIVPATDNKPAKLITIEGNADDMVKECEYELDSKMILGYGVLPETSSLLYTYSNSDVYAQVVLPPETTVARDAVLSVKPIKSGDEGYASMVAEAESAVSGTVKDIKLYDISFYTADKQYIPVDDNAKVTIRFKDAAVDASSNVQVLHYDENDSSPIVLRDVTVAEQEAADASLLSQLTGNDIETVVQFKTEGFSTFAVVQVNVSDPSPAVVSAPEEYSNTTNILRHDEIGNLDNKTLMISTAMVNSVTGSRWALTTQPGVFITDDNQELQQPLAVQVTQNAASTNISVESLDNLLWVFESADVANATNDYYIRAAGTTDTYLNIGGDMSVELGEKGNPIYVVTTGLGTPSVYLATQNGTDGRELSFNDTPGKDGSYMFSSYNNGSDRDRDKLILSIPTVQTVTLDAASVADDNNWPLDGKTIVISSQTAFNGQRYVVTSNPSTQDGRLSANIAVMDGEEEIVYSGANAVNEILWTFHKIENTTLGDQNPANMYYIESVSQPGKYLSINAGNSATLWEDPTDDGVADVPDVNCQIRVEIIKLDNGASEIRLLGVNQDRRLSYDAGNRTGFTGFQNPTNADEGARGALTLSVLPIQTTIIDPADATGNNHPLAGEYIAISTNQPFKNAKRGLTTSTVADNQNLMQNGQVTTSDNYVYITDSMVWKFIAAPEADTYYLRAYDLDTKTEGNYLKFGGGANLTTVATLDEAACKFQVVTGNDYKYGDIGLKWYNNTRHLAIDGGNYCFTAFETPNEYRGDLVLSKLPLDDTATKYATNLAGQTLAIVSVRDTAQNNPVHVVTSTPANDENTQRLGVQVEWTGSSKTLVDIPDEYVASSYWTFEAVNPDQGEYYIKAPNGQYLNIGATTATLGEAQSITVTTKIVNNMEVVFLQATGTNYYLNRFGGRYNTGYRGYTTDDNDPGSRFILTREMGLTATVLSRYELKETALLEGAQLLIFVRQKEADGYHYYAMDGNGNSQEIYLQGDNLDDGSIVYTSTTKDDLLLWDGTRSFQSGWNSNNDPAADIDLQIFNVATGEYLVPHLVNGAHGITRPAKGTTGDELRQHDLWKWKDMYLIGVTKNSAEANDVNADIANMLITDLKEVYDLDGDNTNGNEFVLDDPTRRLSYDPVADKFITDDISDFSANPKGTDDKQVNVIYFALVSPEPAEEVVAHETLVGQILTREEYQNAAKEYGEDYPFIIFAQDAKGNFFALDADGKAQPINLLAGDTLAAGERIVFDPNDVSADYNSNLILWDATATADDPFAENQPNENAWVDLTLVNVGTSEYLGPHYNDGNPYLVTLGRPVEGDHSPGFFYISPGDIFGASNTFANYLGTRTGDYTGAVNGAPTYKNERYYKLKLVERAGENDETFHEFEVIRGWNSDTDDQTGLFTNFNGSTEYVFYVAMVVDRNVTIDENNDVDEYDIIEGVTDNVTMYLFNYGAGIDYYGAVANGTKYVDNSVKAPPDADGNVTDKGAYPEHDNLVYRFFHRPEFGGQAIDGTNETQNIEHAFNDPYYDWPDIEYAPTLSAAGYPEVLISDRNDDGNPDFTVADGGNYDLEYLFKPETFVATPGNTGEANDGSLTIKQSQKPENPTIPADNGTEISTGTDGRTPAADQGDSTVQNPNYAKRTYRVGDGSTTGLFQKDSIGNYYYNSAHNAAFFNGDEFELYDYALLPSGNQNTAGGNFLPFNQAHSTGRLIETDPGWQNNQRVNYPINDRTYRLNGVYQNDDVTMGRNAVTDLWFGMYFEIEFAMTPNGLLEIADTNGDGENEYVPLEFEFAGDDDVLVYIDDVLCLDIGRVHGISKASIDFSTGKVTSDAPSTSTGNTNLYALYNAVGKAGAATAADDDNSTVEFVENDDGQMIFKGNSVHTLKFFYLERGGNISNCYIRYNLQPMKPGGLSVEKVVNGLNDDGTYPGIDGELTEYKGEYNFRLVNIDQNSTSIQPPLTEFAYELFDNGIPVPVTPGSDETVRYLKVHKGDPIPDSNGKYYYYSDEFTLKHGQMIHFTNIITGTTLQVQETSTRNSLTVESNYWWRITDNGETIHPATPEGGGTTPADLDDDIDPGISVGNNATSIVFEIEQETSIEVVCSNTLHLVTLGVEKVLYKPDGTVSDDKNTEFTIDYTITCPVNFGSNEPPLVINGTATLKNGVWYDASGNAVSSAAAAAPNRNDGISGAPDTSEYNWLSLNVPFGSTVKINEINIDGYIVDWAYEGWGEFPVEVEGEDGNVSYDTGYKMGASSEGYGAQTNTLYMVAEDNFVTISNWTHYELPDSGGPGTSLYALGGLLLMFAAAAILLYNHNKRRKEERAYF